MRSVISATVPFPQLLCSTNIIVTTHQHERCSRMKTHSGSKLLFLQSAIQSLLQVWGSRVSKAHSPRSTTNLTFPTVHFAVCLLINCSSLQLVWSTFIRKQSAFNSFSHYCGKKRQNRNLFPKRFEWSKSCKSFLLYCLAGCFFLFLLCFWFPATTSFKQNKFTMKGQSYVHLLPSCTLMLKTCHCSERLPDNWLTWLPAAEPFFGAGSCVAGQETSCV